MCVFGLCGVEHMLSALVEEWWQEEGSQTVVEVVWFLLQALEAFPNPFDSEAVGAGLRGSLAG